MHNSESPKGRDYGFLFLASVCLSMPRTPFSGLERFIPEVIGAGFALFIVPAMLMKRNASRISPYVCLVILGMMLILGQRLAQSRDAQTTIATRKTDRPVTAAPRANKEPQVVPLASDQQAIQVLVSSQDAEGATQEDFSIAFLKKLEEYTVQQTKLKMKESLSAQGLSTMQPVLTSGSVYLESGTTKLAIISLRWSDGSNEVMNEVVIHGVIGNELKRIACLRKSAETIPVSYGVCGEKIDEVFSTKLVQH